MSNSKYDWPYGLNENIDVAKYQTKTFKSDFYFMLSSFLFIMALPASFGAMALHMTGLSISIFMIAGFNMLISLCVMFMSVDRA